MKSSRFILVAAALLLCAVGLVIYGSRQIPPQRFKGQLTELLPPAPLGWTKKEKPIADTPEMQEAVGELLNFDDGVFVDYSNSAGDRLSVYVAYWTPGKMQHRLIASHTPDVCWVMNGWTRKSAEKIDDLNIGGKRLPPLQSRVFATEDHDEYVWYWHLVGEESKSYATDFKPPWYAPITDLTEKGLNQREEQFFIRISSNRPLQTFLNEPIFQELLRHLPWP